MTINKRTRWICLGTLRLGGQIILPGGQWYPCCVSLNWRGRKDWCQPWQFTDWDGCQWAVERRLAIAGLRPLALASRISPGGNREFVPLWVQVTRLGVKPWRLAPAG